MFAPNVGSHKSCFLDTTCAKFSPVQAAVAAGYGGDSHASILSATKTPAGAVDYFVELHIEQGPLLEEVRMQELFVLRRATACVPSLLWLNLSLSQAPQWRQEQRSLVACMPACAVLLLPRCDTQNAIAFVPMLQEDTDIGIVTAIAAPAALEVKFFGDGGHAGAQLMHLR